MRRRNLIVHLCLSAEYCLGALLVGKRFERTVSPLSPLTLLAAPVVSDIPPSEAAQARTSAGQVADFHEVLPRDVDGNAPGRERGICYRF